MHRQTNIYKYLKPLSINKNIRYQKRLFCSKKIQVNDFTVDKNNHNNSQPIVFPNQQKQEQQKQEQEEEEKENIHEQKKNSRVIRLFSKVVFISSFIAIFGPTFLFEEKELQTSDYKTFLKKYGIDSLKVRLTDKDIELFCKKIVYELNDYESFYIIYNGYYDQLYQIKLIKAGIYKYCIEYLLKHDNKERQQQSNESILMEKSKIMPNIYYGYLYSSWSFKKILKDDPVLFNNEVCILYKKFILNTIEYNKKFGLPDIQLPSQLEYLNKPISSNSNNGSIIISFEQYKGNETRKNIKFQIFSFATTALYMTFRSSKTIFPNFNGNRISNIILSSITGGLLLFTTDFKNKQLYGNELKKFQDNYIRPIVPNIIYEKIISKRNPWFNLIIASLSTCLLQYRLYFIIPTLFNSYFKFNFHYEIDNLNIL